MLTHQFNDMLTPILEKISLKNKGYVMGDFNITFMDYETETFFLISSMALGLLDQLQIFSQLYLIELLGLSTGLGLLELWHLIYTMLMTAFAMLVFFTNLSLMESHVRYFALFLLFPVTDGFKWFWMESLHKNIQLMLEFPKAAFLVLHFSHYTLMAFLMMLSVISVLHPDVFWAYHFLEVKDWLVK